MRRLQIGTHVMKTSILVAVLLSFILSACGGGGSSSGGVTNPSSSTPSNSTPTSNAGTDQSGRTTTTVSLDGSASTDPDGDVVTYSWIIQTKPDGSTASISDETSVTPSIVLDLDGQYEIELSVSDGSATSTDSVNITAITPSIVVSGNKEIYWQDSLVAIDLQINHYDQSPSISLGEIPTGFLFDAVEGRLTSSIGEFTPVGPYKFTASVAGSDGYMITETFSLIVDPVLSGEFFVTDTTSVLGHPVIFTRDGYFSVRAPDPREYVDDPYVVDGEYVDGSYEYQTRYSLNCFGKIEFDGINFSGDGKCGGFIFSSPGDYRSEAVRVEIDGVSQTGSPTINMRFYGEDDSPLRFLSDSAAERLEYSLTPAEIWIPQDDFAGKWLLEDIGIQYEYSNPIHPFFDHPWLAPPGFVNSWTRPWNVVKSQLIGEFDSELNFSATGSWQNTSCSIEIRSSETAKLEENLVLGSKGDSEVNRIFSGKYTSFRSCDTISEPRSYPPDVFSLAAPGGVDAMASVYWEITPGSSDVDIPALVLHILTDGARSSNLGGPTQMRFVKVCTPEGNPTEFYTELYLNQNDTPRRPKEICESP